MDTICREKAEHYVWGEQCDGWRLVYNQALSIIEERMPPATSERLHRHAQAQQFFYILEGEAEVICDGRDIALKAGQGIHIPAGVPHRIRNHSAGDLRFLVTSEPNTRNDRVDLG